MYLKIEDDGRLVLKEIDDFGRFHIAATAERIAGEAASPDFRRIAEAAGEGHFWLNAEAVVDLSAKADDEAWKSAFWNMLAKAEPYGFADLQGRRLKAHVLRPEE